MKNRRSRSGWRASWPPSPTSRRCRRSGGGGRHSSMQSKRTIRQPSRPCSRTRCRNLVRRLRDLRQSLMMNDRPIVLVTGATGFVGRHLSTILESNGWTVRAAVRRPSGLNEVMVGSVGPDTNWQAALADVDAVVHLAARVHHPNDRDAEQLYRDLNVDCTLQLARSAIVAGVKQFVFASTALVYGRNNDGRPPFSEEDELTPHNPYSRSKVEAEAGLKSLALSHAMGITVVRPPLVY